MGLRSTRLFAVTSTSMEEESGYVLYFALTVLTVWEEGSCCCWLLSVAHDQPELIGSASRYHDVGDTLTTSAACV